MTLDVAIATYRPEGIKKVEKMLPAPQDGVRYIVSWQEHQNEEVPEALKIRNDVEVHRTDLKGLSNNRNNALNFCNGDIVLIADDDLEYDPAFAIIIRDSFQKHPDMDLATFKFDYKNPKVYPNYTCELNLPLPKNYYVNSIELAFKKEVIGKIKFWERMGLGNEFLGCGEEELFLYNAIKKGLHCRFIDQKIGNHKGPTTGDKVSPPILHGQGFIISLLYPVSAFMRIPLKAWRLKKQTGVAFLPTFYHLSLGALAPMFKKFKGYRS